MKRLDYRRYVGLAAVLALAVLVLIPGVCAADQDRDQEKMEAWIKASFTKSSVEYEKITYGDDDYQAKLQNLIITPDDGDKPLAIDEIVFFKVDTDHNPPYFIKMAARGIHLTPKHMDGDIRDTFQARNIKEIPLDVDLDVVYDADEHHVALNNLVLASEGYGRLTASLALRNFYLWTAREKTTFLRFLVGIPSLAFKSADFEFQDDGLVNFVMANRAQKTKKTEAEVLAETIGEIDQDIQNAKTENARQNLGAVKKFLLDPGTIQIGIHPENAIKIKDMKKIQDGVLDYVPLGLTITANP